MKANEVTLGSYVAIKCFDKSTVTVKVSTINVQQIVGVSEGGGINWGDINHIEPIPLTTEIVARSFTKRGDRYGIYCDLYDIELREFNDGMWQVVYHNCEVSGIPDECVNVCWVHELQIFLSHCGIEIEIEL